MAEHNTPNKKTSPDYSSVSPIIVAIFWTLRFLTLFCIIKNI